MKSETGQTTTIRLKPSARAELDKIAATEKRSRSYLVQEIVEEWLAARKQRPPKARK